MNRVTSNLPETPPNFARIVALNEAGFPIGDVTRAGSRCRPVRGQVKASGIVRKRPLNREHWTRMPLLEHALESSAFTPERLMAAVTPSAA